MSQISIAIIGTGGVGKAFISQLAAYISRNPSANLATILISRSSTALISHDYSALDLSVWSENLAGEGVKGTKPLGFPNETLEFLKAAPGKAVVLVDNTSDGGLALSYPVFLKAGVSIVTPNKKGFSSDLGLWEEIYGASANSGVREGERAGYVFHEATVGAGLPVLSTLKELLETGDVVRKVEGVFSGTMSFLFNSFAPVEGCAAEGEKKEGFAECVREARELGFTEPDPRDDLNGLDVARKLTILARLAGVNVASPTAFPIRSLIPAALESANSAQEFLDGLGDFDADMEKLKKDAEARGGVIRYVGSLDVEAKELKVGLESFDRGSAVAGLKGSDNIFSFYTKRYGDRPLVVQGAGAGADVTAMGVLGDLIKVLQRLK